MCNHGQFAYTGQVLCWVKNNASNIGYRNNWCEKQGSCEGCSIAEYYLEGGVTLKMHPSPVLAVAP